MSMNNYPYHELLPLLHHQIAPAQYRQILGQYTTSDGALRPFNIGEDYWQLLTMYTFARCPFCAVTCQQLADTYSLAGWSDFSVALSKGYYRLHNPERHYTHFGCPHLFATQQFLHLHDHLPHERDYLSCDSGEVPYLTNWFFHDDLATRVILHALPICRMVEEQFIAAYTVFSLTYFCEDEKLLRRRHFEWQRKEGKGDPEFYPAGFQFPSEESSADKAYDLVAWAQRGQLGYIDHINSGFPLSIGVGLSLPALYRHILGKRYGYIWRNGTLRDSGLYGLVWK